jgi:N-acetyl-beta-hexosaminidase
MKEDYRRIVAYARQRFITVVPEIDPPGHVNAALASYAGCYDLGSQHVPRRRGRFVDPRREAAMWTETVRSRADVDHLAFPRLAAIVELGWSPAETHDWTAFRQRLGAQGPRWTVMGIDFYRSPQVPWPQVASYVQGAYVYLGVTGTGTTDTSVWTPSTAGAFTKLSVTFTTGPSTTSVLVWVHGWYGQGTYYLDDVPST